MLLLLLEVMSGPFHPSHCWILPLLPLPDIINSDSLIAAYIQYDTVLWLLQGTSDCKFLTIVQVNRLSYSFCLKVVNIT